MSKKTTLTILIILAFVAVGLVLGMFSFRQIQAPQAKEAISEDSSTLIPSRVVTAKRITLGIVILASAIVGAGVAVIITSLGKKTSKYP